MWPENCTTLFEIALENERLIGRWLPTLQQRCHMKERIIALSSLAAGLAALGLVAVIQTDPLALTRGTPPVEIVEPPLSIPLPELALVWSELPAETAPATGASNVLELPPVYIVPMTRTSQTDQERTFEPCSAWRELGPKYVTDGIPTGTQWVRDLC
jgi:hypothetical protein